MSVLSLTCLRRAPARCVHRKTCSPSEGTLAARRDSSVHSIRLLTKSGQKITLADEISNRQEARWVVSQLETLTGLKVDTHVEIDLPLGVSSRPFQSRTDTVTGTSQSFGSRLVAFSFFVFLAIGFFIWQSTRLTRAKARASSSRAGGTARSALVVPRTFSGPLTDADVQRLFAQPIQAQAEELLERAIGHDERAIQLLDQNASEWISRIRLTDRMKQLERRSAFSRDLRVRLANADINLALEGWHKNSEAADLFD
jgi:hypothetical protein